MSTPTVLLVPIDPGLEWRTAAAPLVPDGLITSDPEAAARYGFPRQEIVVTGPESADPWVAWFARRFPRLKVERLPVESPARLAEAWARRGSPDVWPVWWSTRELKVGATLSAAAGVTQLAALAAGRATAIRVPVGLSALLPGVLADQAPTTAVVLSAGPRSEREAAPTAFVTGLATSLSVWYRTGVRALELCPEPNVPEGGWGIAWHEPAAFAVWWQQAADILRRLFPEIRLGWPGIAPTWLARHHGGVPEEGFTPDDIVERRADWVGVRAPWRGDEEIFAVTGGLRPWEARRRWPRHLLMVTGFGPVDAGEPEAQRAAQCLRYIDLLQGLPGVGAAFTDGAAAAWLTPDRVSAVARRIGERPSYSVASN